MREYQRLDNIQIKWPQLWKVGGSNQQTVLMSDVFAGRKLADTQGSTSYHVKGLQRLEPNWFL